ncbi:MAG: bifunctional 5,10-methylenetetrahydrofolate dehydrogenase/5,10-methenyltetrahydrofolate cyclohydrolase [Candidatus Paceibacterota bacterium]
MSYFLDGRQVRDKKAQILIKRISAFSTKLKLVILQVGNVSESNSYIEQKKFFGTKIGVLVEHIKFPETVSQAEIESAIELNNRDASVHGIILQLPIPARIDWREVVNTIDPEKDVDGLTRENLSILVHGGKGGHMPATARGVLSLLKDYKIEVAGKKVVVVGRSALVGKPIALSLLNEQATVTICHSKTQNLNEETKRADILIVAIGKAHFINESHVREGQIVIDVGINSVGQPSLQEEIPKRKLVGDVFTEKVTSIVDGISPVPGGVGPLTVLSLFENLADAYEKQV